MARSKPTRSPRQERGKLTVAAILQAAADMLLEVGFENLTTNAVAARAGVNISTLYAYFPNKYAIVEGLLERFDDLLLEMLTKVAADDSGTTYDLGSVLDLVLRLCLREPWMLPVIDAIKISKELQELKAASLGRIRDFAAAAWAEAELPKDDIYHQEATIQLLVETIAGGLQLAVAAKGKRRKALMDELKRMVASYLETF